MDRKALLRAGGAGAAAQVLLVLVGHFVAFVADNLFAVFGVAIALVAGALYGRWAPDAKPLAGGAAVGAAGAFIGIALSVVLGDVPGVMLLLGTLAAAIGGLVGAGAARLVMT